MSTPTWIPEIFSAVMILVAEVSAGQLVIARAWTRRGRSGADIAVSQLLIAIALAGVLVPGLSALPNAAWDSVFVVMTGWFAWSFWRESRGRGAAIKARAHLAPHLVRSGGMLYLFAALAAPSAGAGMAMSGGDEMSGMADEPSSSLPTLHAPTLALIVVLLLIACTVHDLDRPAGLDGYFQVAGRGPVPAGPALAASTAERVLLSSAAVKGCQVAIGVTMAFLLIIMI